MKMFIITKIRFTENPEIGCNNLYLSSGRPRLNSKQVCFTTDGHKVDKEGLKEALLPTDHGFIQGISCSTRLVLTYHHRTKA